MLEDLDVIEKYRNKGGKINKYIYIYIYIGKSRCDPWLKHILSMYPGVVELGERGPLSTFNLM